MVNDIMLNDIVVYDITFCTVILLSPYIIINFFLGVKFCRRSIFFPQYTDFTMHSIISIMGVVLTSKENNPEWSKKIKHTLIFNELWKGVCVGDGDKEPKQPNSDKEFTIWENKNNKVYALIATSINEEVSHHIS